MAQLWLGHSSLLLPVNMLWFSECHPIYWEPVCVKNLAVFPQLQKYIVFLPVPILVIMAVFARLRKEAVIVPNARNI